MRSVHERHRMALIELDGGRHLPVIVQAARTLGLEAEHAPHAMRSTLREGSGPFAEMVLAVGPRPRAAVSVECWVSRPDGVEAPYLTHAGALGWVSVTPITDDPVAATAAGLDGQETSLVRYHRGRRATVRVTEPTDVDASPVAYAKVFSDHRGAARHDQLARLAEAEAAGRLNLRVPRPIGYDAARFVLWQHEVAGVSATGILTGPVSPEVATRLGAALASLHTSNLRPTRRLTSAGLLLRAERYATEVCRLVPALGERVRRLLDSVGADRLAGREPIVPVHGSPDPSQWLVDPEEAVPGLLDFDRYAWGEPEMDLACFLVEVEALGKGLSSAAVSHGFLTGYQAAAGRFDLDSLRRHCTMRRIGKVVRAARAVRVDGDLRAGRVLAAAERASSRRPSTSSMVGP